jgi:hypothetical protein
MEISYNLAELCTLLPLMMRKITPPEGLFPVAAPSLTLFALQACAQTPANKRGVHHR